MSTCKSSKIYSGKKKSYLYYGLFRKRVTYSLSGTRFQFQSAINTFLEKTKTATLPERERERKRAGEKKWIPFEVECANFLNSKNDTLRTSTDNMFHSSLSFALMYRMTMPFRLLSIFWMEVVFFLFRFSPWHELYVFGSTWMDVMPLAIKW